MLLGLYLKSNDKLKLFGNSDEDEKESELDYNEDKDQREEVGRACHGRSIYTKSDR